MLKFLWIGNADRKSTWCEERAPQNPRLQSVWAICCPVSLCKPLSCMRNTIYTLMLTAMIESSCLDYTNVSSPKSVMGCHSCEELAVTIAKNVL